MSVAKSSDQGLWHVGTEDAFAKRRYACGREMYTYERGCSPSRAARGDLDVCPTCIAAAGDVQQREAG